MEKIRNRATELIQELVPSIMELSDECKVIDKDLPRIPVLFRKQCNGFIQTIFRDGSTLNISDNNYTVIGRDIHLEDVLLACLCSLSVGYKRVLLSLYSLNRPFKNQSKELYEFLIKTLS